MKNYLKAVAAITVLVGATTARAEDDSITLNGITLYGAVDAGFTYQTHSVASSSSSSVPIQFSQIAAVSNNKPRFTVIDNGLGNSNFGIKGGEQIGDGWSVFFDAEDAFNPLTGVVSNCLASTVANNGVLPVNRTATNDCFRAGQLFNNAAYIGVSNPTFGTLTAGYQNSLNGDKIIAYDPAYTAFAFSALGYFGLIGGSGSPEGFKLDNSLKYNLNIGPVHGGAEYQFPGTLGADNHANDNAWAFNIGAQFGDSAENLAVDAVYARKNDNVISQPLTGAQIAAGVPISSVLGIVSDNASFSFLTRYTVDKFAFYGGYENIVFSNPSSILPIGTVNIGGYELGAVNNNAYAIHRTVQIGWVGARYHYSPQFEVAVGAYHTYQNSYATGVNAGCHTSVNAFCSGAYDAFSTVGKYHVTKRFDIYGGVEYSRVSGGLQSGFLSNNNFDPTIGARFTF